MRFALARSLSQYASLVFPVLGVASEEEALARTEDWMEKNGVRAVAPPDPRLGWLNQIEKPPAVLYIKGDIAALDAKLFAIVGARRPSPQGLRAALYFSKALSEIGLHIVSGLARGIDGAAHQGALTAKVPTVAVLGHGLDRVYPSEHALLTSQILEQGGCLLTEYPPFVPPLPAHFPQRNRLISGLSRGVLVVEAAERSGSLITAQWALDQGRDVFAMPGNFDQPNFLGNHRLIQMGAKLVVEPKEIAEELGVLPSLNPNKISKKETTLRNLFEVCGKMAPLEDLFSASSLSLPKLLEELEEACRTGQVREVAPQQFAWMNE